MPRAWEEAFDDTDLAILEVLQQDGRAPVSTIARRLDLPESTVRARTRKILSSGLIDIVATGDPLRLGIPVDALSLVRVEATEADAVADTLAAMHEVRYVGVTLGGTTLAVESLHPSAEALHAFLARRLPGIPGVKEVHSHQIIDIRKSVWDWQSWLKESAAIDSRGTPQEDT